MIRRLIFFVLLSTKFCPSIGQNLSTYFLDSLRMIVDNEMLLTSSKTKVYFVKNTTDTELVLYNKKPFRLVIDFKYMDATNYLDNTGALVLYRNNKAEWLSTFTEPVDSCGCDIACGITGLSNAVNPDIDPEKRTDIKLGYRFTYFAPKDTSKYHLAYRQGLWVGRHTYDEPTHNGVISVNYTKDLKDGKARMVWDDGGSFETSFEKGKKTGEGQLDVNPSKVAKYRRRPVPVIISSECAKDKE